MKKILLTGGGTAGHVTPNIALLPGLKERGYEIKYVGSYDGIEKNLIKSQGIEYVGISSGKLRRYLSKENLTDIAKVFKGIKEAKQVIKDYKPDVVFSKGGFVSVPVVLAAKKYKVPVIIHESDMTPGLANKIAIPRATYVCHNFPETADFLPKGKAVYTGSPIRAELLDGDREIGLEFCCFDDKKPVILIIGGSLGAGAINDMVRKSLDKLLPNFNICHLCGKGKLDESLVGTPGYVQYEYISKELKDLFAMADVIISRAGANAIFEFLAIKKPSILIPLPASQSRGDQILNAKSFEKQGFAKVIDEDDLSVNVLVKAVNEVYENREDYVKAIEDAPINNAVDKVLNLIDKLASK